MARIGAVFCRCGVLPVSYSMARTRHTRLTDKGLVWPVSKRVVCCCLSLAFHWLGVAGQGQGAGVARCFPYPWQGGPVYLVSAGALSLSLSVALLARHSRGGG